MAESTLCSDQKAAYQALAKRILGKNDHIFVIVAFAICNKLLLRPMFDCMQLAVIMSVHPPPSSRCRKLRRRIPPGVAHNSAIWPNPAPPGLGFLVSGSLRKPNGSPIALVKARRLRLGARGTSLEIRERLAKSCRAGVQGLVDGAHFFRHRLKLS